MSTNYTDSTDVVTQRGRQESSADFQVCRIAGFQTCRVADPGRLGSRRFSLLALILLLCPALVWAHHPGFSTLAVQVRPDDLAVEITLARLDTERLYPVDSNRDGSVSAEELDAGRLALEELALGMVEVRQNEKTLQARDPYVRIDENGAVQFGMFFGREREGSLKIRSAILSKLPADHRQYFTAYDTNRTLRQAWLLETKKDSVDLAVGAPGETAHERPTGFWQFLKLGVEHIVTGYDHLIFLLGLLIVGGRFVAAVKIITAFTVAHSITLALATFDLIPFPTWMIEPLIAASIVYVGIENIFRRDLERRWMLAFGFGLIHGLGFASILRDMGVGRDGGTVAVPLLSFNLGVEAGQLVIAALVLPIIWKLKNQPSYQPRYVPAFSLLIAAVGAYWLVTRIIGVLGS